MNVQCSVLLLGIAVGLSAQERPSQFELSLPEFFDSSFASGVKSVIEIPDREITRLRILIRDAQKLKINPGAYKIFVNGKGIGNVFEERSVSAGTLLVMEPELLRRRPDRPLDKREKEYAFEIIAQTTYRKWYGNWLVRINDSQQNSFFASFSRISADDPKGVPPDLVVTEPAAPPVFRTGEAGAKVRLKGRVSRGATLSLNGKPIQPAGMTQIVDFDQTVDIEADRKELVLEALDGRGNQRQILIPVYRPAPAPRPRFAGQKYALIIGISRFGASKGAPPAIPGVAAQAEEFAQQLEKIAGFKHENIRLLVDEKATLESVRVGFSDFAAKAEARDALVVYIVTHGLHDPRPGRSERMYMALQGTQLAQLESSSLAFSDLEILLNRSIRTNQAFLVFDISHPLDEDWTFSGGKNLVNNHIFGLFGDRPAWSILVSGSGDEISRRDQTGAGLFQQRLVEALGGAADINRDGVVTAAELYKFVSEKVKSESGGAQIPRFRLPAGNDSATFLQ